MENVSWQSQYAAELGYVTLQPCFTIPLSGSPLFSCFSCFLKGTYPCDLSIESAVQTHNDAARVRMCTAPLPACSCGMSAYLKHGCEGCMYACRLVWNLFLHPAVWSYTHAARRARLHWDQTVKTQTSKTIMQSCFCTLCYVRLEGTQGVAEGVLGWQ